MRYDYYFHKTSNIEACRAFVSYYWKQFIAEESKHAMTCNDDEKDDTTRRKSSINHDSGIMHGDGHVISWQHRYYYEKCLRKLVNHIYINKLILLLSHR